MSSLFVELRYVIYIIPFVVLTVFLMYRNHWPQPWKKSYPDFDKSFLKYVATDTFWGGNQEFQLLLSQLLSCYRKKKSECQGVIISFGKSRFQMIQFDPDVPPVLFKGVPMIPLEKWGHCTKLETALTFLGSDSKAKNIETIPVSSEDLFRALFEHLAATCHCKNEEVDAKTRCRIYRGQLSSKKV